MKCVVFGCRRLNNAPIPSEQTVLIWNLLDFYFPPFLRNKEKGGISELLCGMAMGVDSIAFSWASQNDIPITAFHPNWEKHGKKAGILRNIEMANQAKFGVGFWDGKSRGTKHMIDALNERGIMTVVHPLPVTYSLKIPEEDLWTFTWPKRLTNSQSNTTN